MKWDELTDEQKALVGKELLHLGIDHKEILKMDFNLDDHLESE